MQLWYVGDPVQVGDTGLRFTCFPTDTGPRSDGRGLRDAGLFQFTDFRFNGCGFQLGLGQRQAHRDSRALVPGGR